MTVECNIEWNEYDHMYIWVHVRSNEENCSTLKLFANCYNGGRFVLMETLTKFTRLVQLVMCSNSGWRIVVHLYRKFLASFLLAVWWRDKFQNAIFLKFCRWQFFTLQWRRLWWIRVKCGMWDVIQSVFNAGKFNFVRLMLGVFPIRKI